jgi:hypothetical protein
MKQLLIILTIASVVTFGLIACKKWKDPAPTTDPRLTKPYCNDPEAVNYNWGFPGKPDNTLCFYPKDLFVGNYLFVDSVYIPARGLFIYSDSIVLHIYSTPGSNSKINVIGFCGGDTLKLTAGQSFIATVDTLIGDSLTYRGQYWCRKVDTVSGTIFDSRIDTLLHINLQIVSDTGITTHIGKAKKI